MACETQMLSSAVALRVPTRVSDSALEYRSDYQALGNCASLGNNMTQDNK
jgi:hypothetical protein